MSVPRKNTTWGRVRHEGNWLGVLGGFHLSDTLWKTYDRYVDTHGLRTYSSAPWATRRVEWEIVEGHLYLCYLFEDGLLSKLFGKERLPAEWVESMDLLVKDAILCPACQSPEGTVHQMTLWRIRLQEGRITDQITDTDVFVQREPRSYIREYRDITTLHLDAGRLEQYLKKEAPLCESDDLLCSSAQTLIDVMGESRRHLADILTVLDTSWLGILGQIHTRDVSSAAGSFGERIKNQYYEAHNIELHLTLSMETTMQEANIIAASFEEMVPIRKEGQLLFGLRHSKKLEEGEAIVRVLVVV